MNQQRLLWRLVRLARRRPRKGEMLTMAIVFGAVALVAGVEHFIGWPDWATVNRMR